uniref:Secreted protein of Ly-6 domain 1 n=1 Tax=Ovis aries TaxID=9940 RepID=A0AC11C0F5_SHEEP
RNGCFGAPFSTLFPTPRIAPLTGRSSLFALECFQCDRVNTSGVCVSGGGTCQTQGGQQCFLRKIYEDGTLSYGRQGCSQLCTPMKLFNPSVIVEYKCCHDSPLCNKF